MNEHGSSELKAGDEQLIDRLLNPPGDRSWRRLTLTLVLEKWQTAVRNIEAGYNGNADDYWYDLTWRDRLQVVIDGVPPETREGILRQLVPLDDRFIRATCPDGADTMRHYFDHGPGWWWLRLPDVLVGRLANSPSAHSSQKSHTWVP